MRSWINPKHDQELTVTWFDGPSEAVATKASKTNAKATADMFANHEKGTYSGEKWWGPGFTKAGADRLLTHGWPGGAEKMRASLSALSVPATLMTRRRPTWGAEGDELSMDRVMNGDYDVAWRTSRREVTTTPGTSYARIAVSCGAPFTTTADKLFWRGAAAIMLADALEAAGRRVQIILFHWTRNANGYVSGRKQIADMIPIKGYDDPLDPDQMASWTATAGALRSTFFTTTARFDWTVSESWGSPTDGETEDKIPAADIFADDPDVPTVWVRDVWDKAGAQAWLEKAGQKFAEAREGA